MSLSDFAELFEKGIFLITFWIIGCFYFLAMWVLYVGVTSKRNYQVSVVPTKKPFDIHDPITGKVQIMVKKDTNVGDVVVSFGKKSMTAAPHDRWLVLCKETLSAPLLHAGSMAEVPFTFEPLDTLKKKFLEQRSSPQLERFVNTEGEGNIYHLFVELKGEKRSALHILRLPVIESSTVIFQLEDGKIL